jgi:hypothetical protein
MSRAKVLVIDDLRSFKDGVIPADTDVTYARTSLEGLKKLRTQKVWDQVWFDHDLGIRPKKQGDEEGTGIEIFGMKVMDNTRPCAHWMADPANPIVAKSVMVMTASPVGGFWLMSTLSPRYPVCVRVSARTYFTGGF